MVVVLLVLELEVVDVFVLELVLVEVEVDFELVEVELEVETEVELLNFVVVVKLEELEDVVVDEMGSVVIEDVVKLVVLVLAVRPSRKGRASVEPAKAAVRRANEKRMFFVVGQENAIALMK